MSNKIDVLARISPQMAAVLAKEDELAGDANDTSAGFEQMRENYVLGRAWWNEGAPEMVAWSTMRWKAPSALLPCGATIPAKSPRA